MKRFLKNCSALVAVASMLQPGFIVPAAAQTVPIVTTQPNLNSTVSPYAMSTTVDPVLPNAMMANLVRQKIKYVFVLFNENESFDHEFGTFPGANGLYTDANGNPRSAADTPGFTQSYYDVNGNMITVQPFLIGPQQNSTFADSTDHSHTGLASKLLGFSGNNSSPANAVKANTNAAPVTMSGFAQDEYNRYAGTAASPGSVAAQKEGSQFARLVMSHVDCNTIPFFWQYANRFTLFDNIFATEDTPSSPNAIAMIAGQAGETQWVEHGSTATAASYSGSVTNVSVTPTTTASPNGTLATSTTPYSGSGSPASNPIYNDPQPFYGSVFDPNASALPNAPKESWAPSNISQNQTYANVLLTLAGSSVTTLMAGDTNAADKADIASDITAIQNLGRTPVGWRWYQNGYGWEPQVPAVFGTTQNVSYVSHHNGAQYFGYISNNPSERGNIKSESSLFTDLQTNNLPAGGGVIYIRGGYYNIKSETPPIQNPNYPNTAGLTQKEINTINLTKSGDDDHPSYSDHQISEAMNARVINTIISNPTLWAQSAIVITYDESDGLYDHVAPQILAYGPDSLPQARGIRIPLILISPYARAGAVSHAMGDHNAIIETINSIFNLPALSSLPAESAALAAGNSAAFNQYGPSGFQQKYLGPRDTNSPTTDSLLSGFSPNRLRGLSPILPASYAFIKNPTINTFPHYGGKGCSAIGVTPTDANMTNVIPGAGTTSGSPQPYSPGPFNTLPSTLPAYD